MLCSVLDNNHNQHLLDAKISSWKGETWGCHFIAEARTWLGEPSGPTKSGCGSNGHVLYCEGSARGGNEKLIEMRISVSR